MQIMSIRNLNNPEDIPEIYFSLAALGSFNPDDITFHLGIAPSNTRRKGEVIPGSKNIAKYDDWVVYSEKKLQYDLETLLIEFLKLFEGKESVFTNLYETHHISFVLEANITMFTEMNRPIVRFRTQTLEKLVDLGFTFGVAIYPTIEHDD